MRSLGLYAGHVPPEKSVIRTLPIRDIGAIAA